MATFTPRGGLANRLYWGHPKLPGEAACQGPGMEKAEVEPGPLTPQPWICPCAQHHPCAPAWMPPATGGPPPPPSSSRHAGAVSGLLRRWNPNPAGKGLWVSHSRARLTFPRRLCARHWAGTLVHPTRHVPLAHGRASSLSPCPLPSLQAFWLLTLVPKPARLSPTSRSTCCSLGPHSGNAHVGPASPADVERLPQRQGPFASMCVSNDHRSECCGFSQ